MSENEKCYCCVRAQVSLPNGMPKTLIADSATSASELCAQVARQIGLRDTFGFALFITLYDKVSSLGSGRDHVMDAISQCEQYAKEHSNTGNSQAERSAPWRLFFRKELFAPWHDPSLDAVAARLIYDQIIAGIRRGDYRLEKLDELASVCAQHYYVENGPELSRDKLGGVLTSLVPSSALNPGGQQHMAFWLSNVGRIFQNAPYVQRKLPQLKLMEDIGNMARYKWPLLFSRFYEARRVSGPELTRAGGGSGVSVVIAVNWTGVYLIDENEQVLLEMSFPEIASISCGRLDQQRAENAADTVLGIGTIAITTVRRDEYVFSSPNCEDMKLLIVFLLEGLKQRSHYVIATQNYNPSRTAGIDYFTYF